MEKRSQKKPLSNTELSAFCSQIAMILESGISVVEGITIMADDAVTAEEKVILNEILAGLIETGSFYQALEHSGLFPQYLLHMTDIGEQTGKLDEVMSALSDHYEREDNLSRSVQNAVTYPCIMVGMMVIVILVLIIKVMPIFNQVFIQLGTQMSGFSLGLMNIGSTISRYSVLLIAVLVLILMLILYLTRTSAGRRLLLKIGYKLPGSHAIYEGMAACRFADGISLTLSSGLNPDHSMELVSALTDDPVFLKKLDVCKDEIAKGRDLTEALFTAHIFNGMYARMASIGSRTGSLDKVMAKIAGQYEQDIDTRLSNILAVLEPTLVIILSLIVGIILLSVMLPLMGIMSSL